MNKCVVSLKGWLLTKIFAFVHITEIYSKIVAKN